MYLLMSSHSSFWIQSTCWASFFIFLLSYNRNYLGLGLSCKWIFCYHYFRSLYHWCLPSLICWLHNKTYSDIFFESFHLWNLWKGKFSISLWQTQKLAKYHTPLLCVTSPIFPFHQKSTSDCIFFFAESLTYLYCLHF